MGMSAKKIAVSSRLHEEIWSVPEEHRCVMDIEGCLSPYGRRNSYWLFYPDGGQDQQQVDYIEIVCKGSQARELTLEFTESVQKRRRVLSCEIVYDRHGSDFVVIEIMATRAVLAAIIERLECLAFQRVVVGQEAQAA